MRKPGRILPSLTLVLGVLGCALGGFGLMFTWSLQGALGQQLGAAFGVAASGVGAVGERLDAFDDALEEAAADVDRLARETREAEPGRLRELEREVARRLLPDLAEARDDLRAIGEVVRAVAGLLGMVDPLPLQRVPRFGTTEHEGLLGAMEAVVAARTRLEDRLAAATESEESEEEARRGLAAISEAIRALGEPIREVRALAAPWRQQLSRTRADLQTLREDVPRTLRRLALVVSVLILWGFLGQVCLARSGWQRLQAARQGPAS